MASVLIPGTVVTTPGVYVEWGAISGRFNFDFDASPSPIVGCARSVTQEVLVPDFETNLRSDAG